MGGIAASYINIIRDDKVEQPHLLAMTFAKPVANATRYDPGKDTSQTLDLAVSGKMARLSLLLGVRSSADIFCSVIPVPGAVVQSCREKGGY